MNSIHIHAPAALHLLWLLPILLGCYLYAWQRQRDALRRFISAGLLDRVGVAVAWPRRHGKAALVLAAVALLAVALCRPGWNPQSRTVHRMGRDVVFLLDVSRSMLAEDLVPSRLERAKMSIRDCVERLAGDRVALVVFAGDAVVQCPLTLDYGFFRQMLDRVSVDSVSRGGTMIGDALRTVMEDVFDNVEKQHKDIILITDGEDHDSFPVQAAEKAYERGVRIIAIGLGDENEGRRIPVTAPDGRRTFLTYQGREIWSRLDADTLRKMVNATPGGKYFNVATGTMDLGEVYEQVVAAAEKRQLEAQTIKRYEEKFQIFLGLAFLLLLAEPLIPERRRASPRPRNPEEARA